MRATSPSTPRPATGSCTSTPTRCSSATTSTGCARSPAGPGARPSTSSRRTSPASSATAPRSPTTRCGCSATGPSTASRAACTSRSPRHLPALPARAPRADLRPSRALRLPRRRPRRQGEVATQHRAAAGAAGRGADRRRSCTSTSAPSTPPPATRARPSPSSSAPGRWSRDDTDDSVYVFAPTLVVRLGQGAARVRAPDDAIAQPNESLRAVPGLHRPRLRAGSASLEPRAGRRRDRLLRALHRDGRRARPLHRDGRLRHLPAADRAGRARACTGRSCAGARAARLVPERAPRLLRHGASVRLGAAAQRRRRRDGRRRDRVAGRRAHADRPLHARDALYESRRVGGGRPPVPPRARTPAAQRAGPRRARRDAPVSAPVRRGAPEAVPVPEDDPLAANACRTELFGRVVAGDLERTRKALARASAPVCRRPSASCSPAGSRWSPARPCTAACRPPRCRCLP